MIPGGIPGIREWRPEGSREPMVRIGVVLDEDAQDSIEMHVPEEGYDLCGPGGAKTIRDARVRARLADGRVGVSINEEPEKAGESWWLAPRQARPAARGDGVLIRGVVAGRGFHWQKRVDQMLAGRIELRAGRRGLVLVNELPLETYLAGVITAEMSGGCPGEFLRAQCIVARSWLLAFTEPKHGGEPFDRCNDDCCQRYQGTGDLSATPIDAVASTRGLILVSTDGRVVDANYSKSCGGVSELPEHVWGVHKPGLAAVADAPADSAARQFLPVTITKLDEFLDGDWLRQTDVYCSPNVVPEEQLGRWLGRVDVTGAYFRWTVRYNREELEALLRRKLPEAAEMAKLRDLRVVKRGVSGRATEIAIDFDTAEGWTHEIRVPDQYRIRQILHESFLFSSAFAVRIERDHRSPDGEPLVITLRGAGWGHGAGFCQIGALGMALKGIDHERIVRHYFPEAELRKVYE